MARWIGVFCGLLIVNLASAQEYAVPPNPQGIPVDGVSRVFVQVPGDPYRPQAPAESGVPHAPSSPYPQQPPVVTYPQPQPPQPVVAQPQYQSQYPPSAPIEHASAAAYQPPPLAAVVEQEPLEIVVYEVADLVVGANSSSDPNQAMLAMLAQQSEEFAFMLNATNANGGESQTRIALGELAETLESTFEDDFGEGRGTITLHGGTMSLIVRQTPAMHEQIRGLLTQLRRINDTSIQITLKLAELDDATLEFAMSHSGQILDAAALQQFNELNAGVDGESMSISVSTRNGQNTSLYGYGFPASLTAIATEDRRTVRVNLNMMLGLDEGLPAMQHNHRVPAGQTVLMTLLIADEGYVVLMSADIDGSEEEEVALQANTVVEQSQIDSLHLNTVPEESEPAAEPAICFQTEAILATVEGGTPDEVLMDILELTGTSPPASAIGRAVAFLNATSRDQLVQMLEEDEHCSMISRPHVLSQNERRFQLRCGRDAWVVTGVSLVGDEPVPSFEHVECGLRIDLDHTITDDGCICLEVSTEQSEFHEEEVVLTGGITFPIKDVVTAESTFTIPPGQTLVWPVPRIGDEESTLLIILTSQVER